MGADCFRSSWQSNMAKLGLAWLLASTAFGNAVPSPDTTLKKAAEGLGLYVGSAMNYNKAKNGPKNEADLWKSVFNQNFDSMTAENACKAQQMITGPDVDSSNINLAKCQSMKQSADQQGDVFRGHTLFWPSYDKYPDYISDNSPEWLENWMTSYISYVVEEIGDIYCWDVVNEAISNQNDEGIKDTEWSQIPNFLCKAFTAAKTTNPNILMFYNDYQHESMTYQGPYQNSRYDIKSDQVFELVSNLTAENCGIDGVGFQSHFDINISDDDLDGIRANIRRYADIGILVHMTEIDVRCCRAGCTCPVSGDEPWTQEMVVRQAEIYRSLAKICIEEPNCVSWTVWTLTDNTDFSFLKEPFQKPALWDDDFLPKLAFDYVIDEMVNADRGSEAVRKRLAWAEEHGRI